MSVHILCMCLTSFPHHFLKHWLFFNKLQQFCVQRAKTRYWYDYRTHIFREVTCIVNSPKDRNAIHHYFNRSWLFYIFEDYLYIYIYVYIQTYIYISNLCTYTTILPYSYVNDQCIHSTSFRWLQRTLHYIKYVFFMDLCMNGWHVL